MNVLFCHNSYQVRSGEDIAAETDLRLLREHGIRIQEYRRSNDEIREFSIFQKIISIPGIIFSFRTYRDVRALVRRERPDVALIQNVFPLISPSVYFALAKEKVPIVQLAYNYRLMCANGAFFTQGRNCTKCLKGSFLNAIRFHCFRDSRLLSGLYAFSIAFHRALGLGKKISAYVSPARFLMERLAEAGYPASRLHHVFNPFPGETFKPEISHQGYFLFFGRLVREKGIFTLLEAARLNPALKITVVGKGEAETAVTRMIHEKQLRNVEFVGPKYGTELDEIVRGATAIVCPVEWHEVSPLVIYQAFSCAKPVISSRIAPIPELVRDGENGLLFAPGDASDLGNKMRQLLADEPFRVRLAEGARKMARESFTSEIRYQRLVEIFQSLVSAPG